MESLVSFDKISTLVHELLAIEVRAHTYPVLVPPHPRPPLGSVELACWCGGMWAGVEG